MTTRRFFTRYMLKPFILISLVFLGLCTLGYLVCLKNMDAAKEILESFVKMIQDSGVMDENGDISAFRLFLNNLRATGMAAVLGILPFFFLPVIVLLSNGIVTGAALALMKSAGANLMLTIATGLLPHGIFEIPAIMLGATIGILICLFECEKILERGRLQEIRAKEFFRHMVKIFVCACIPLLVIAALIETYVTPILMNMVL